ncbi:MAG: NAD-dependent epimerase/dehydratase family protein [Acidimicrobiales bacterium]
MRVVVTGSEGFVGRHLVAHLRASGEEVVALDRETDVTDRDALDVRLRDVAPAVVYHLAALSHVGESWRDPQAYTRVNVEGTRHVLAVARESGDPLVVVVSSADVYGVVDERDLPLDESHPPAPANPYAASKLEAEQVTREAASAGQRVVIVRPFNHLGPGQAPSFVVAALARRLLAARESGRGEVAVGELSARRDFTDVRDVVRAYRLLARHAVSGETYHVASGRDVSIAELARELARRILPGARLVRDEALVRPVELPVLRGDATKLRELTGWEPVISLSQSLDDVVASLREGPS